MINLILSINLVICFVQIVLQSIYFHTRFVINLQILFFKVLSLLIADV